MTKRKKVGEIARDLLMKHDQDINSHELTAEVMKKDYVPNVLECIAAHIKEFNGLPFYIVVGFRGVKVIANAQRIQYWARLTCPKPTNDQAVFYYEPATDFIEEMWSIPDRNSCKYLVDNALMLSPEERPLLKYVLDYMDGTLDRIALERDKMLIDMGVDVTNANVLKKGFMDA